MRREIKTMNTRERAEHLARAAQNFVSLLGKISADDLLEVVRCELGHEAALDDFQKFAAHFSKAQSPETILHIISGNTPHAGLQSLIRGLLVGARRNFCKLPSLPSSGGAADVLQVIEKFRAALPAELAARVETSCELPGEWLAQADAVIVFGSDETIAHFQKTVRIDQRFIAHGAMVSIGIVFNESEESNDAENFDFVATLAARDASLFDQQGCLSPHGFYVEKSPEKFAERLAREMEKFQAHTPRGALSVSEAAAIDELRAMLRLRAANGENVQLWCSEDSSAWTVFFDPQPTFSASCLNRVVFVKPLPLGAADFRAALENASAHLSAVGIWPATRENAERVFLLDLGASRICPIGRMQMPPFSWHQDGGQNLAPLVRWIDFEPESEGSCFNHEGHEYHEERKKRD